MKVLDKGFIEVIDSLGNDLTIVNSARVSFGKRKTKLDDNDIKLMKYLVKHKHYSPFRQIQLQFHIKAPEFVMRQWYKHVVGIETTSSYPTKDHAWNEISGRYAKVDEFYSPEKWRKQSKDNKQGSKGEVLTQEKIKEMYRDTMTVQFKTYLKMLELSVAKEQARTILPLSIYTEVYWTASFQAIMNFIELRTHDTAQWEIKEYANAMYGIMLEKVPLATMIWFNK